MNTVGQEAVSAAIEEEFDVCVARMNIVVPAEWKGGVLRGYQGLRDMAARLREEFPDD
ncbi:hypothetical protein [Nocardia goodfellowii]|uniref:Uncharacterized protein n=1 Tax=Nocardia goodfellowii TaxID=882446 RepID=A0ABS4QHW1_9NOCA|nr:hypothetical protein [Nocardia goodfellowii]MBP2191297.1 hypothetical protein [Nocardia goodfellowii]